MEPYVKCWISGPDNKGGDPTEMLTDRHRRSFNKVFEDDLTIAPIVKNLFFGSGQESERLNPRTQKPETIVSLH